MKEAYRDLGVVANTQEPRTCAMTRATDGCFYLVICSQGFLVSVNLHTKEACQFPFPENYIAYPFGSIASKSGKIYLGGGNMFLEFDPAAKKYTFAQRIHPDELSYGAWCLEEAEDGTIYFGGVPKTYLTSFNPNTREIKDFGILDPTQTYLGTLAVDRMGYLYCTIGTETVSIVAIDLKNGKRHVIPALPGRECAEVCRATDGEVYVTFDGDLKFNEYTSDKRWYRLLGGELLEEAKESFQNYFSGTGFDVIHCPYIDHPTILNPDLVEHELTYIHPDTGETVNLSLEYETAGAELSPLTCGPDGKIYGTTNHPIQIYKYDPKEDRLINFGRKPFAKRIEGWGNICAYAVQGDILGGCAYCGGFIVRIDTKKEICRELDDTNPHCEGAFGEIYRPRSAAALPDGRTMVFGGYTTNGATGGGLVIYDTAERSCKVIPNDKLIPQQSVLSMVPLSQTELLCGTSIEAPCGGYVLTPEAQLFEFDLSTGKVLNSLVPVPGAREISHLKRDATGIAHGITSSGIYFAYDPDQKTVLRTQDMSQYGVPVRDGMKCMEDGTVYGLLTGGIYRVSPASPKAEMISIPPCPITAGMAVQDGKIFFGSGTHLWYYVIE